MNPSVGADQDLRALIVSSGMPNATICSVLDRAAKHGVNQPLAIAGRLPAALAPVPRRKRQRRGFQTTTAVLLGTTAMSRR